ncbi:MAG TPA: cupin domain-containing protein [Chryseolinea sp.]|nr:cupin domain-containing protein [Chryseolinea sp.]HPM32905.1 cupin domain-containing protein [Chryseolinea sp.]
MNTDIRNYIVKTAQQEWKPLIEGNLDTSGIFVKVLRFHERTKRAPSILLKFEAGAYYPYHNHPAGEELFVIEGDVTIEGERLSVGDYLYTPPNFKHSVKSENGCIVLFSIPEEVEII